MRSSPHRSEHSWPRTGAGAGRRRRPVASRPVLTRPVPPDTAWNRALGAAKRAAGELVHLAWETAGEWAAIGPATRRGRRFGAFGDGSVICFPPGTIMNEHYIHIGSGTMIGPSVTLSAGMVPGQQCVTDPVVSIGDRCLIGRGSGIVGHLRIEVGDDVWTGHNVYITDQNHGYADPTVPVSRQVMPERPVCIGERLVVGLRHGGAPGRGDRRARGDRRQQRGHRRDPVVRGRCRFAGARDQGDPALSRPPITAPIRTTDPSAVRRTPSRCRRRTSRSVR